MGWHQHHCPVEAGGCGAIFDCSEIPCEALIRNGQMDHYCDLCWGMLKDAYVPDRKGQ